MMALHSLEDYTIDNLAHSVQALPQELFELIYEYTFTPDSKEVVINDKYKPPIQLQVDRHSRKLFAAKYYGQSTFTVFVHDDRHAPVRSDDRLGYDTPLWLRLLPDRHQAFLYDIVKGLGPLWVASLSQSHSSLISRIYIDQVSFSRLDLSQGCASDRAFLLRAIARRRCSLKEADRAKYLVNYQDGEKVDVHGKPVIKWAG